MNIYRLFSKEILKTEARRLKVQGQPDYITRH